MYKEIVTLRDPRTGKKWSMRKITEFERAQIRLRAFELLEGWGAPSSVPNAEKLSDRLPIPWDLEMRKKKAKELADWALE